MHWLFTAAWRLRELGILGMNRRNAACILDHNPRGRFPLVDDKMRLHRLCAEMGVPTPRVYAEVTSYSMLRRLNSTQSVFPVSSRELRIACWESR